MTRAVARLVEVVEDHIRIYPYDWKKCLKERRALHMTCRQCASIEKLHAAVEAVKLGGKKE